MAPGATEAVATEDAAEGKALGNSGKHTVVLALSVLIFLILFRLQLKRKTFLTKLHKSAAVIT